MAHGLLAVLLNGGSPPLLSFLAQAIKQVHEVLAEEQQRPASGVFPKARDREGLGVGGVFGKPVVYLVDFGIEIRVPRSARALRIRTTRSRNDATPHSSSLSRATATLSQASAASTRSIRRW